MIGWVRNILSVFLPPGQAGQIGQGAQAFERKAKARLLDVTDGVKLAEEVRRKSAELLNMVRKGGAGMDRLRLWLGVRRKVKRGLVEAYEDLPDLVDEVTEKIREAAEHDPFLRRLFR